MMICTAGFLLCIFYYIALVIHNGFWQIDFSIFWIFLGMAFGGAAVFLRYEKIHGAFLPVWLRYGIVGIVLIGILIAGILGSLVVRGMQQKAPDHLEYVIVLGAHVRGDIPSKALQKRINRAYEYARENPDTILILSGGQGYGEDISEAECMKRCLCEMGIDEKRMVMEDRSTTTRENLLYSNQITACSDKSVGIVSNDFHIFRALYLAKNQGYKDVYGVPAPTDTISKPNYVIREIFALLKAGLIH